LVTGKLCCPNLKVCIILVSYTNLFSNINKYNKIINIFKIVCIAHVARARLRDRHQENLKKKLEVLKAQQRMEESLFDPEEGSSSNKNHVQMSQINLTSNNDKLSTSKNSPSRKENAESSTEEDIK